MPPDLNWQPTPRDFFAPSSTYHADAARSGHYVVPGLTLARAGDMRRDAAFDGRVPGHVYAQPDCRPDTK
jgi:hypothetical protein